MTTNNLDRLYELLPKHIRAEDVEQGQPLQALLRVIARQVDVVENDIAQLYDNWFIETCQDWVVPYIGELIGYEPIEFIEDPGVSRSRARDRILLPRREVANTIRYRARKGTLKVLEDLAMDITNWAARAVEFFAGDPIVYGNDAKAMENLCKELGLDATMQDEILMSNTIKEPKTSIGIFLWRRRSYPSTDSPPNYVETQQGEFYTFSPLGNNTPLYTRVTTPNGLRNLPFPITRAMLTENGGINLEKYYGKGKSFCISAPIWPLPQTPMHRIVDTPPEDWVDIPAKDIVILDLSSLRTNKRPDYKGITDKVAIDPECGRFVFPPRPRKRPSLELRVTYYSGYNADIGGGEYQRPLSAHPKAKFIPTSCSNLKIALEEAIENLANGCNHVLIEIKDSGVYLGYLPDIILKPGQTLQIRAENRKRPVIWIVEKSTSLPDSLRVLAYPKSCFILDGVLVAGRGVHLDEPEEGIFTCSQKPGKAVIRHSTLVPGWLLEPNSQPIASEEASIELNNTFLSLLIQRSIIGSISVAQEDVPQTDPSTITIEDSIIDSTSLEEPAIYGEAVQPAYISLTVRRSTVLGEVEARELPLAENSIFRDKLTVHNRQGGIIRYSYVPEGSRTPPQFHCQNSNDGETKWEFKAICYGTANYCLLEDARVEHLTEPHPVIEGGEFGGEMGVYYHLFQPWRKKILEKRLEEYLPVGVKAAIFFVEPETETNTGEDNS